LPQAFNIYVQNKQVFLLIISCLLKLPLYKAVAPIPDNKRLFVVGFRHLKKILSVIFTLNIGVRLLATAGWLTVGNDIKV
jgi:hypothetical protein